MTRLVPSAYGETPVAQYLRMSTENQKYSTRNQRAAIADFVAANNMKVVKTFEDKGRSGLTLAGRSALQSLLRDVLSHGRKFEAIVVYDVSRWGRFQDVDESAFYEHLCRRAGVSVHYCAESFDRVPGPMGMVIKSIKRAMAAEYSKELSAKVSASLARLARKGYYAGGPAGFALKRVQVAHDGRGRRDLLPGERKSRTLDHVELAPGDPIDCGLVRLIFYLYVRRGLKERDIARQLNWSCYPSRVGLTPWRSEAIRDVLRSEHYIGTNVYGAHTQKLRLSFRYVPKSDRIRVAKCFAPIVSREIFNAAQRLVGERQPRRRWSNAELLDLIRQENALSGHFSSTLLARHGGPAAEVFIRQFGSVADACKAANVKVSKRTVTCGFRTKQRQAIKAQILVWLGDYYRKRGRTFYCHLSTRRACVERSLTISVRVAHPQDLASWMHWLLVPDQKVKADMVVYARVTDAGDVLDYYVIPGDEERRGVVNSKGIARGWLKEFRCEFPSDVIRRLEKARSSRVIYVTRMLQQAEARRQRMLGLDGSYKKMPFI